MSGMDVLRERIARALWEEREHYTVAEFTVPWDGALSYMRERYRAKADAVIAALGLGPAVERYGAQESDGTVYGWEPDVETVRREWRGMPVMRCRFYVTPWERIEEDG